MPLVTMPDGVLVEMPDELTPELGARLRAMVTGDKPEPSVGEKLKRGAKEMLGFAEAPLAMGSGIVASVLGGWRGILGGGAEGVQKTQEALTYQPRTEVGKTITKAVATPFEMASEGWGQIGQAVGGDAGEAIGKTVVPVVSTLAMGRQMQVGAQNAALRKASEAASKQVENLQDAAYLSKIKAAKDLNEMGGVFNPADVKPTLGNRTQARIANINELQYDMSRKNAPQVINAVKRDLGIAEDSPLNMDALQKVRSEAGAASNEIRSIPVMKDNGLVANQLEALRPNPNILGQSAGARKVHNAVEEALTRVQNGMSGSEVIDSISTLRRDARATLNSRDVKPKDRRVAEAQLGIADSLETLIENNISDASLLSRYRSGRALQAKTYVVEDIMDPQTGAIDLSGLNRGAPAKQKLTGNLGKLQNIAANFPGATAAVPTEMAGGAMHMSRTGVGGSAGAAVGAPFGAATTMGIGGTVAELLGAGVLRNRLLSPQAQAAALPKVTNLYSPLKNISPAGTANLPVPYVVQGELNPSGVPNWTFGRQTPDITVTPPETPPMLGFTPNAEMVPPRQWANRSKVMEQEAAAAEAAAPRQPTSGGMLFDLDPVTGRLRPADQGLKSATPHVISNMAKDLQSALDKMRTGRRFDLTSNEKIALRNWRQMAESDLKGMLQP